MNGTAIDEDMCDLRTAQRISALLDRPDEWRCGDTLPRGWHFGFFIPAEPQSRLPTDGFPAPSEPDVDLPASARVMLGGRTAHYTGDIRIGQALRRTREIVGVERKEGRTGLLVIVSRRHKIFAGDDTSPVIIETEDMIYRAPSPIASPAASAAPAGAVRGNGFRSDYCPTPVELFRYSALTFNGHRIHYDAPYAIETEGYPALVVNGGLTALMLVELFRREMGRDPVQTATRNRGPILCGYPATLNLETAGADYRVWAADNDGRVAIEMMAR